MHGTIIDPNWSSGYYFQYQYRACVYFVGTTIALLNMIRTDNIAEIKKRKEKKAEK